MGTGCHRPPTAGLLPQLDARHLRPGRRSFTAPIDLLFSSACTALYVGFEPGFWPAPVATLLYVLTQLAWGVCCVVGIVLQLREYRTERLVT
jgi:hypothetical protein